MHSTLSVNFFFLWTWSDLDKLNKYDMIILHINTQLLSGGLYSLKIFNVGPARSSLLNKYIYIYIYLPYICIQLFPIVDIHYWLVSLRLTEERLLSTDNIWESVLWYFFFYWKLKFIKQITAVVKSKLQLKITTTKTVPTSQVQLSAAHLQLV